VSSGDFDLLAQKRVVIKNNQWMIRNKRQKITGTLVAPTKCVMKNHCCATLRGHNIDSNMLKLWPLDLKYESPTPWKKFNQSAKVVETRLRRFASLLSFFLCTCQGTMQFSESFYRFVTDRKYNHNKLIHSPHHSGQINEIIAEGEKVSQEDIQKWACDLEHGLSHSFVVAFLAFWMKYPEGIPDSAFESAAHLHSDDVKLMCSCLFHDFYKVVDGEEDHDKNLKKYFKSLTPQTYTHSYPTDNKDLLVASDRLDLMRYPDYKTWCNLKVIDHYLFDPNLVHFYQYTRPALEKLFKGRDDVWIMHGVESVGESYKDNYPPPNTYMKPIKTNPPYKNAYPIEIGDAPFRTCLTHSGRSFQPWGFITLKDFKEKGGKICLTHCNKGWEDTIYQPHQVFKDGKKRCWTKQGEMIGKRDHMYATSDIPISDWIFILRTRPPKTTEPLLHGGGVVDFVLANQIIETTTKLINHLKVLKC
jgi:hypothetical protein